MATTTLEEETISVEEWNVAEDLPFLFAYDAALQDDLACVVDLLDMSECTMDDSTPAEPAAAVQASSDSCTSDPSPTSPRLSKRKINAMKGRPSLEVRQRRELLHLRAEVEKLQATLDATASAAVAERVPSMWETAAKAECLEKNRSLQENAQLKETLHQQATFVDQMQKLCRKKPRWALSDVDSEEWKAYKVAAHASLRTAAIHAIADRQFHRMQNVFIGGGIFGRTDRHFRARVMPRVNGRCMLELVNCTTLPAPFPVVAAAAWSAFGNDSSAIWPDGAVMSVEMLDDDTLYSQLTQTEQDGTQTHSNIVRKRFVEPDRHVIIARTVLEDALVPHMSKGAVESKAGWTEVARVPTDPHGDVCVMRYCMQLDVDHFTTDVVSTDEMDMMVALMHRVTLAHPSSSITPSDGAPSLFSLAADGLDWRNIPSPTVRGIVGRAKRASEALAAAVNAAIAAHHAKRRSHLADVVVST
ncbi:Aste57867_23731 [Aphanomyces stellatus]|uniref:Aste57867_23731 protein n=1 Tax=Aphanomyces stellatus TaxID=120398 RepID=A0A485LSY9_9STRA|nr:hypothetical protein As57867_023659 [Aphanomyces stellatus]VFU00376.1 Aste57867_23731 [Aphanomyces stellatus]